MENLNDVLHTHADDMEDEVESVEQAIGEKRDVSGGDGGVIKELLKAGTGYETPEKGDKVTVHYVGTLESDGSEFDSSRTRGDPFSFTLGQGQVIKGWDIGVATMKKGEIAKLYITADYGYGASGSPPKIPGGATLVFEVELIEWKSVKDIMGDGGIIKTVVKEGEGWSTPKDIDEVVATVSATVQGSNTPFFTQENAVFTVQDGFLCKAISKAIVSMKVGEVVKLAVKPPYGLFDNDAHADVSSDAALDIDITLHKIHKVEKITPDGGVMKKSIGETSEWQRPNPGATVTVSYKARLPDGTVFEERTESDPLVFITDEEKAPTEGLELGVMQMKKGETAVLTVHPEYGYSSESSNNALANTVITYDELKLIDLVKAKETWDLDADGKLEAAKTTKDKGNVAFKAGKLERAITLWERAKQTIEYEETFSSEQKRASRTLKNSLELNLAAAQLKANRPVEACKAATKVLEADSSNVKALYRRAQAYIATSDWVEAAQDIKRALQLAPDNADFKILARKLKSAEAASSKKEAQIWATSFAKMSAAKSAKSDVKIVDSAPENANVNGGHVEAMQVEEGATQA